MARDAGTPGTAPRAADPPEAVGDGAAGPTARRARRILRQRATPEGRSRPYLVICGDDPLAHRLAEELISRHDADVTVVLPSRRRNHGPQIAKLPGVGIVEADRYDDDAFRRARVNRASALAITQQDDVGNIHAALRAQELNPDLRLVIRMFNMSLGHGVRNLFRDCAVISDASIAAPEFVAAALGEVAPSFVRLPGRTVYVARRADVHPQDVVCGIAVTAGDGPPEMLPADGRDADLVLAVATRRATLANRPATGDEPVAESWRARRRALRRRPITALSRAALSLVDRKLKIATVVLLALLTGATIAIGVLDGVGPWEAIYTILLTAVASGEADLETNVAHQVIHAVVSVAGLALIPVVTATVVDTLVNARLAAAMGRLRQPLHGHVVVIGLGNVGTRVIRQLHEFGHDVVAIDKTEQARGAPLARELDIPLIIGDASEEETLRQASVQTARALLVLSTSDVTNLEAALNGRHLKPGLRVVLRLFDGDFARRVERAFGIPISRSVSFLAAPAFAAAMLEREVIGTIAVDRWVLLIAEIPVAAGSPLDGARIDAVTQVGLVRVIALARRQESRPTWTPAPDTRVAAGDRLIVVATPEGLGQIVAGSGSSTAAGAAQREP